MKKVAFFIIALLFSACATTSKPDRNIHRVEVIGDCAPMKVSLKKGVTINYPGGEVDSPDGLSPASIERLRRWMEEDGFATVWVDKERDTLVIDCCPVGIEILGFDVRARDDWFTKVVFTRDGRVVSEPFSVKNGWECIKAIENRDSFDLCFRDKNTKEEFERKVKKK